MLAEAATWPHVAIAHSRHAGGDASLHAALPPDLARAARQAGWGEPHYLVHTGQAPPSLTMLYASRDAAEREVILRLPNNDSVLVHATMPLTDGASPRLQPPDLGPADDDSPQGLPGQASTLVRTMGEWAFVHENELRTFMRLSLAPRCRQARPSGQHEPRHLDRHPARRPTRPRPPKKRATGCRSPSPPLFGADAVVWSTDIAGADRETALDVMAWMAAALVQTTLDESA